MNIILINTKAIMRIALNDIIENKNDSIAMRIRGKSNVIEMKTGSLRQTIYEQNKNISFKRKRQIQKDKLRKLEMLERYREERLLRELRLLEEEKKILQQQHKQETLKEKRRIAHAKKVKDHLEELRLEKLEEEIRLLKPHERKQFKNMLKYGEI